MFNFIRGTTCLWIRTSPCRMQQQHATAAAFPPCHSFFHRHIVLWQDKLQFGRCRPLYRNVWSSSPTVHARQDWNVWSLVKCSFLVIRNWDTFLRQNNMPHSYPVCLFPLPPPRLLELVTSSQFPHPSASWYCLHSCPSISLLYLFSLAIFSAGLFVFFSLFQKMTCLLPRPLSSSVWIFQGVTK